MSQYLSRYGMVFVLMLLCIFFSAVTYREQSPTGAAAGSQLASIVVSQFGKSAKTILVVGDRASDVELADAFAKQLSQSDGQIVSSVRGEPKDAREVLVKLNESKTKIDVIACSQMTSNWLLFSDLHTDFPNLGKPII